MMSFYKAVAAMSTGEGRPMTPRQARRMVRQHFRTCVQPILQQNRLLVPETEEGQIFVMDMMSPKGFVYR